MKIYDYKDGKFYFENNEKKPISQNEFELLFENNSKHSPLYRYFEEKVETSKFALPSLSSVLAFARQGNYTFLKKVYEKFDVTVWYLYKDGELVCFTNGDLATEKGDENWQTLCEELKNIDPTMFK